jgi:hypothetical protein
MRIAPRLLSTAEGQGGAFNLLQASAAGHNRASLSRLVAGGAVKRVLPTVYQVAGCPRSWKGDVWAAILWAGEGSAASVRAAARIWGLDGMGGAPLEISTVQAKRCAGLRLDDGTPIIVHRVDHHLHSEIVVVGGMPVTSRRRTFIDLAGMKHPRTASFVDASSKVDGDFLGHAWLLLEQYWMRGRRGIRIGRDLLMPLMEGRAPTDSDLEIMARRIIDRSGLPAPVHQFPMTIPSGDIRIDIAYLWARLALELDSLLWHLDRKAFERDRRRDNELRAMGWTVFRFTWAMLKYEPDEVLALIRSHLASTVR